MLSEKPTDGWEFVPVILKYNGPLSLQRPVHLWYILLFTTTEHVFCPLFWSISEFRLKISMWNGNVSQLVGLGDDSPTTESNRSIIAPLGGKVIAVAQTLELGGLRMVNEYAASIPSPCKESSWHRMYDRFSPVKIKYGENRIDSSVIIRTPCRFSQRIKLNWRRIFQRWWFASTNIKKLQLLASW